MFIVVEMILGLRFFFIFCLNIIVIHLCVLSTLVIIFDNLSKLCLTYSPNKFCVMENVGLYDIQFAS